MARLSPLREYRKRFLGSEIPPLSPQDAFFHVIPVPWEAGVSYGAGAAGGPDAILEASNQLELFDGQGCPGERGIFTHKPVDCGADAPRVLARVAGATARALDFGALPVLLGGGHTLTLGALKALQAHFGRFGVIQLDAHADLRDRYQGSPWSHACVMRRVVADLGLPLVQLGVRLFSMEEKEARARYAVTAWDAPWLARNGLPARLLPAAFPDRLYLTLDVDGLDPSVIPHTGTPVPGGLGWYQALDLLARAAAGRRILGIDVVELAPRPGGELSDFAAASLAYAAMGLALGPHESSGTRFSPDAESKAGAN
jgi:agmatinase